MTSTDPQPGFFDESLGVRSGPGGTTRGDSGSGLDGGGPVSKISWRRVRRVFSISFVLAAVLLFTQLKSGYAVYEPGPAHPVVIASSSGQHPWLFTTVSLTETSVAGHVAANLFGRSSVPANSLSSDSIEDAKLSMEMSQQLAWAVAENFVDTGEGRAHPQVSVLEALPGSPAEEAGVNEGDVIVAVNGVEVGSSQHLVDVVAGGTGNVRLLLDDGRVITVTPEIHQGVRRIGVRTADRVDIDVPSGMRIDAGAVGGPSAGLMFTLAYIDELTGGDLAGGKVVAGTGTINADGTVGAVNGVQYKVEGAADAGADVFLVPAGTVEDYDRDIVPTVAVSDIAGAVAWLCANGGVSPVCERV